jgi:hypothetical protein
VKTGCNCDRADDLQSSGDNDIRLQKGGNGHNLVTSSLHFQGELKGIHCGEATNHPEDHFLSVHVHVQEI